MGDWLSLVMFVGALLLLSLGYPVALSLGGTALIFAFIGWGTGDIANLNFWGNLPLRIFGIMKNDILLAVPYFIFLGSMLEKTGIAERLLETMGILFGRLRGGLALAVVLVGALLAASTGVVAASVVAMGLISLPVMLRYGYNKELATGVIVASGTLGQIIPPSLVLVVLGDQLGISVGDLFIASLIPGVMMAGAYALHILIVAWLRPDVAPALPAELREMSGKALGKRVVQAIVPPLVLIVLVLGSIFVGFATPTEAGAIGSFGAMVLAAFNRQLSWSSLRQVCDATLRISSMVMLILIGSTAFSLVFRELHGDRLMLDLLTNLPGGEIGFLVVSLLVVFLLGFFIDFFEIAFIVVPIFVPAIQALVRQKFGGEASIAEVEQAIADYLLWYGVVLGANLQTSFLTPPFGFALFYLRGVAPPQIKTEDIYRGAIPFIALQLFVIGLIIAFPDIVHFLPSLTRSAEASPPPI